MIGLSNLDADKERNLRLLNERGWFDIPVVYSNNRRAVLAMEKGRPASGRSPMGSRLGSNKQCVGQMIRRATAASVGASSRGHREAAALID